MDLKVKIITEADNTALKQTGAEMKKLSTETAAATPEINKLAPALEESGKAADKAAYSKKTLKDLLKELQHVFPGAGQAALLLKNPLVILVGALTTAISAVRAYIQSVDELAASVGIHEAVSRSMLTIGGAARDAAAGLRQFKQDMDEAATAGGNFVEKMKSVEAAIDKASLRETEKRDANEALAIAKVNAGEKDGKFTPQQAIQQRLNITNNFAARREAARKKAEAEKIEAKGEAIRSLQESRLRAEAVLPAAEREAAEAARAADAAPTKQKSDLEEIDKLEKDAKARQLKLQKDRSAYEPSPLDWMMPGFLKKDSPVMLSLIDEELDSVGAELEGIDNKRAMVNRAPGLAQKRAEAKGKRASGLKTLISGARDAEGGIFNEIVSGKQQNDADQRARGQAGALQGEARGVTASAEIRSQDRQDTARLETELARAYKDLGNSFEKYHGTNINEVRGLQMKIVTLTGQLQRGSTPR